LFQQIKVEATRRELEFLIIGGLAVTLHGYSRDTADLDLLIPKERRDQWLELFSRLDYKVFHDAGAFIQLTPPKEGAWPVDLMLVSEKTFRQMYVAGLEKDLYGVMMCIPKLEHLLALKLHALTHGRIHRYLKDYLDIENLIRINHVDLKSETMLELFRKHGTMELYEKVSFTSARE
jgi:hypothetical protein